MGLSRRGLLALGIGATTTVGLGAIGCATAPAPETRFLEPPPAPAPPPSPPPSPTPTPLTCVLTAEQDAGPYQLDTALVRRDITEGKVGQPLILRITVADADRCVPLANAAVELWQCDAWGYYSGFTGVDPGGTVPPVDAVGGERTYLRGIQPTGADGVAEFATIVPGWYAPRATHLHCRVRLADGGQVIHTGQLFLPDAVVLALDAVEPYARHAGTHTLLQDDGFYQGGGVAQGLLAVAPGPPGTGRLLGRITLGVRPAG